ncbi:MAG: hypothetical protein OHK0053_37120 [Microscillaceae bacterium]
MEEWVKLLFPYFQENGLRGLTVDTIAQFLQKSKATIYEYFETKEEIIAQVVDWKLAQIGTVKQIIQDEGKGFKERCQAMLHHQAEHISDISNLFLADLRNLYPSQWAKIEKFLDDLAQLTGAFYRQGITQEAFQSIHPGILVLNDQLFFRALTNPDFLASQGLTLRQAFDQFLQLKFFGLLRDK